MSKPLDRYLGAVESYLKPLPALLREAELKEIAGHLEQSIDDLQSEGYDAEEASALAVKRFGRARTIGLNLRDVWEGNQGPILAGFTVILGNWLPLILSIRFIGRAFFGLLIKQRLEEAIAPVFIAWLITLLLVQPFLLNFIFGWWGGRRAMPAAVCAYLPLFLLCLTPVSFSLTLAGMAMPLFVNFSMMVIAAASGAYAGALWRRRQRFSIINTVNLSSNEVAIQLLQNSMRNLNFRHLRPVVAVLSLMGLMGALGFGVAKYRMDAVLHPATPEQAVRVMLSDPGFNFGEMKPSTNVVLTPLPPQTPAEKAGRAKRIAYSATMHATPSYRVQRLNYLKKQERAIQEGRQHHHELPYLRAAMKRLRPEGYRTRGIAKVVKAPDGWHVDTSGNEGNQPWAWLYDIYYEEPK